MKPIQFTCEETLPLPAEEIAAQILDLDNWSKFTGYGPLPGITRAEFLVRTPDVVGTKFAAENTDGSRHVEEIVEWDMPRRFQLRMHDFTAPVHWLAEQFDETWEFQPSDGQTRVLRSFALHPKAIWARPLLWMISLLLRRAVARHLRQLRG